MTTSPAQVLQALLANPLDSANVRSLTTPDVTYVSLNEDNAELRRHLVFTSRRAMLPGVRALVEFAADALRAATN